MKRLNVLASIVAIATVVFVLDQITKSWVRGHVPLYGAIYPFPGLSQVFRITHLTNPGIAFGFLRNAAVPYALILAVIAVTAYMYVHYLPWDRSLVVIAVGLQLGGALGNLYDRLYLGRVTDFIDFYITWKGMRYHYPPFNLADSAIVVGVGLLLVTLWYQERADTRRASAFVSRPRETHDDDVQAG